MVIVKTFFITMGKLKNSQNINSVHHKHKCCENRQNFVRIKEVSGGRHERGSVRDKREAESGTSGTGVFFNRKRTNRTGLKDTGSGKRMHPHSPSLVFSLLPFY